MYKNIFEFLVWDNCNNNCKFCIQRDNPRLFNKATKITILNKVVDFIKSDKFIKNSHILVCGGEIFDNPSIFPNLNAFFAQIDSFMADNTIDLLYLNTNLIYNDISGLDFVLNLMKDKFDRLKFTTSYDLYGRFKKKEDEKLFFDNLIWIKEKYPKCNIVVNTILTKQTCEKILNNEFSVKNFMKAYDCWINLIPYIIHDPNLSANKTEIFSTLLKVDKECPGYLKEYIPNMCIDQPKLLYMYKNDNFEFCSSGLSDCGHSVNFKRYSTDKTCFCCDLKNLLGGMYE